MIRIISIVIVCLIFISNCREKEVVFQAVKDYDNGIEKIEIYLNNKYSVFYNDSVIGKGVAAFNKERLLLSIEPKSIEHSLVQSTEYEIIGGELCPLIFDTRVDTSKYELILPRKIVSKYDCYTIILNKLWYNESDR